MCPLGRPVAFVGLKARSSMPTYVAMWRLNWPVTLLAHDPIARTTPKCGLIESSGRHCRERVDSVGKFRRACRLCALEPQAESIEILEAPAGSEHTGLLPRPALRCGHLSGQSATPGRQVREALMGNRRA
jgi:hypothetical protein